LKPCGYARHIREPNKHMMKNAILLIVFSASTSLLSFYAVEAFAADQLITTVVNQANEKK
jgi:hypothetical protein